MKVRTIAAFLDKSDGVVRPVGDVFDVTEERLAEINACGPEQNHTPLVEVVEQPKRRTRGKSE